MGGIAASLGRELQDEPLGVPYGGLSDGEESELGEDDAGVEEVEVDHRQVEGEVGVHHMQVGEVQSLQQVCPDKDLRLLLPPVSLLGEESHC